LTLVLAIVCAVASPAWAQHKDHGPRSGPVAAGMGNDFPDPPDPVKRDEHRKWDREGHQ